MLRRSAMQLLIGAGRLNDVRLLGHGDRVRVDPKALGGRSTMKGLLATKVADFQLASGTFELIRLFAITDGELVLAAKNGIDTPLTALSKATSYPVNDVTRGSVA